MLGVLPCIVVPRNDEYPFSSHLPNREDIPGLDAVSIAKRGMAAMASRWIRQARALHFALPVVGMSFASVRARALPPVLRGEAAVRETHLSIWGFRARGWTLSLPLTRPSRIAGAATPRQHA
jgi:hypothetical protein